MARVLQERTKAFGTKVYFYTDLNVFCVNEARTERVDGMIGVRQIPW